jgi:hypothetical protein
VRRVVRFGLFELDGESGELRKQGVRIQLQPKVQKLLSVLVENPGKVITREELHRRLWDDGTFVDFESGLNTTATGCGSVLAIRPPAHDLSRRSRASDTALSRPWKLWTCRMPNRRKRLRASRSRPRSATGCGRFTRRQRLPLF